MPKTISEIYTEYKIMPSLQVHMLRVAAVASLICDNFEEPLPKEDIITACLLHDMGNIIKAKLEYFPDFLEPEGIMYWQGIKGEFIKKYGNDEHNATNKIMQEVGISEKAIYLANMDKFGLLCEHRDSNKMDVKITNYSDNRVNPHGVVSFMGRMDEAKERYKGHVNYIEERRQKLVVCGEEIEKQIFTKCKIKPEDITDETVAVIIEELKGFVVK